MSYGSIKSSLDKQTIYAFAHCEAWLDAYAKSINQSSHELTERVGTLLLAQGEGIKYNLPPLRRKASKTRKTLGKMAMASRTRSEAQVSKRKYNRKGKHWTQLPRNRSKVLQALKRMRMGKERKAA